MPKRDDIKSILIIGAGPIVIGQACEFDYSGTQACKALKAEGYRIILVNSNPATIMTDPELADATYVEPITPEVVAKIIEKERPDALLPTMGGQTALNTALALARDGVLEAFGVEMIGAKAEAIDKAEDRKLFREAMDRIGLESPRAAIASSPALRDAQGHIVGYDRAAGFVEAMRALEKVGLPAIIRPAFTLGGTGGGVAYNRDEFEQIVRTGLDASPAGQILIDESLLGWKEFEMEVVRDKADNCIIVCSIENVDPMGVHTGDSITVAPALTLTDKEYQIMRNASIAVLREIGVETGGSNVQFAVNPDDGRLVVIEMNPRVSRSSALASKATGFPIAKVAAKLAVGYTLDELENDITGGATPASFEPTIDYVVTKIPRFAFEKFPGASRTLTTAMKSVGEVMAIGRTFAESLQKALRGLESGLTGLDDITFEGLGAGDDKNVIRAELGVPTPERLLKVAQAMRLGFDHEQIYASCHIDPWFLARIQEIIDVEARVIAHGLPKSPDLLRQLKAMGFSDARLAKLAKMSEVEVRAQRLALGVMPVFKRIDTCAAEFASPTAYMYSTYERGLTHEPVDEAAPSERDKVIILGGGPNRIGQGIEFDYCCCHACFALSKAGMETIMVNCNPETVSTDYDTSDRLYFEPLTAEDVLEIIRVEQSKGRLRGVIVQFGGQTPLKLAHPLEQAGVPILGTSPDAIDLAEDRDRFRALIERLGLTQPESGIARTPAQARAVADALGYPVVIRPSFVLGGRAMEIVADSAEIDRYVARLSATLDAPSELVVSAKRPLLIDRYLSDATEVDVDCLCDGKDTFIAGIMEHIEEAGIHSGDSACSLPPHALEPAILKRLEAQTRDLALALNVVGLMNVQYAVKGSDIYILEVNPRASRTVPFVAKVVGKPIAGIAARVMNGEPLASFKLKSEKLSHVGVKEAVFPFARFPGVDTILGPEMRSTGEVMGIDRDFAMAFAKSQLGSGTVLPRKGTVFVSVREADKAAIVDAMRDLVDLGFRILATRGT
ncbi:MAG TPA: carbamoyl-phosphate synthase large subunit, partial [Hyphomicrobiaceae bacterium]|nr:carbamoyl-phosphate synthase large subunit [Hyphomicrobiaceae bacterium]